MLSNYAKVSSTVELDRLVESIHITDFVRLLAPAAPSEVIEASDHLRYRSQIYLFVTLDLPRITTDQWIYFPDPKVPFARFSEMKNFSSRMAPDDKTSLFIEFFCNEDDAIYSMNASEIFELAMPHLERMGFFTRKDVRHYYVYRGGKDYPVYDVDYKRNIKIVRGYLDRFENLYYIGRPGRFKYTNQDHSLEMGILAARSIIENRRFSIEDVGGEGEYFEKGYAPLESDVKNR